MLSSYWRMTSAWEHSNAPRHCEPKLVLHGVPSIEEGTKWKKTAPAEKGEANKNLKEKYIQTTRDQQRELD